jgi:hypothetical protein
MQRPSFARVLVTLVGMILGGAIGFVVSSVLLMFLMRCGDPTGLTCADRHGFIALGLSLLFGLPVGATIGGWNAYHLVGWLTSRPDNTRSDAG